MNNKNKLELSDAEKHNFKFSKNFIKFSSIFSMSIFAAYFLLGENKDILVFSFIAYGFVVMMLCFKEIE
jgi:hypothetical protein